MFSSFSEAREHYLLLDEESRRNTDFTTKLIWDLANIPKIYQDLDISKDWCGDESAQRFVQEYFQQLDYFFDNGIGVIFLGPNGTGKTFLATQILKEAIRSFDYRFPPLFSGYFSTFSDMISFYTEGWVDQDSRRMFEVKVEQVDILVIDDIGAEYMRRNSNLNQAALDEVLRKRIYEKKINIITSNKSFEQLKENYGSNIISLLGERTLKVIVSGEDFRRRVWA